MRQVLNRQLKLAEVDISQIQFDPKSRDDIPQILMGLQSLYTNTSVRKQIFRLLEKHINPEVDNFNGRPGMVLWKIFVMAILRVSLNWDYDRLHEMVNKHETIREMLGHGVFDDEKYHLQTIKDNVRLLTPELLNEINQVVVEHGHSMQKKEKNDNTELRCRCDSFVVETDVHFPTDINLLNDAIRKTISLTSKMCSELGVDGWRQSKHNINNFRSQMGILTRKKHSTSKDPNKREEHNQVIESLHREYVQLAENFLSRAEQTQNAIIEKFNFPRSMFDEIKYFVDHAKKQIDLIERRVFNKESIPHKEKVFSIFQPHTEWICKGKRKVRLELGLNVAVIEDQYQFILNHMVMQQVVDKGIAVPFVKETKKAFPNLVSCSFDKGFYSFDNRTKLEEIIDNVMLPKQGKLSQHDYDRQHTKEFIAGRKQHPAIESAINALEVHGLDRCLDHGIEGFKRYVGIAVVARNIQIIGVQLQASNPNWWRPLKKHKKAA